MARRKTTKRGVKTTKRRDPLERKLSSWWKRTVRLFTTMFAVVGVVTLLILAARLLGGG